MRFSELPPSGTGLVAIDRGQSLVEFTLVIPLFLLLVAGMVDFGLGCTPT